MNDRKREAQKLLLQVDCGKPLHRGHKLAVSIHEIGHCLFLESFGARISTVGCQPNVKSAGFVESTDCPMPLEMHASHILAGAIAEHPFIHGKPFDPKKFPNAETDVNTAIKLANVFCSDAEEIARLLIWASTKTHELIQLPQTQRWLRSL